MNHGFSFIYFSIRRIIVIIESVKSVETDFKQVISSFLACLKNVDKKDKKSKSYPQVI